MGICASCLGGRPRDSVDDEENDPLFPSHNGMPYGSFDHANMSAHEDPAETQREIEALQRVVARTSDNMVDIYEIIPHDAATPATYAYPGRDARLERYRALLNKVVVRDSEDAPDWTGPDEGDEGALEMRGGKAVVPPEGGGALVGNFADAAAAMH